MTARCPQRTELGRNLQFHPRAPRPSAGRALCYRRASVGNARACSCPGVSSFPRLSSLGLRPASRGAAATHSLRRGSRPSPPTRRRPFPHLIGAPGNAGVKESSPPNSSHYRFASPLATPTSALPLSRDFNACRPTTTRVASAGRPLSAAAHFRQYPSTCAPFPPLAQ